MVNVWQRWHSQNERKPLPPILPILVTHAEGGWTRPLRFGDLLGPAVTNHPELAAFVPDFSFVLEDLHDRTDESLQQDTLAPGLAVTLATLRDARHEDIAKTLRRFMSSASSTPPR